MTPKKAPPKTRKNDTPPAGNAALSPAARSHNSAGVVRKDLKLKKLENYLLKKVGKAMLDYEMLGTNDRILVGVSGGKDSWAMLKLLQLKNRQLPPDKKYTLVAAHINFQLCEQHDRNFDTLLEPYGIEYHTVTMKLPEKNNRKMSQCFWCSWNRRKLLFNMCRDYNCTKLALGHHLDDIAETMLMNQFFYGEISTMPPNVSMFKGALNIIRPLAYIHEKQAAEYAKKTSLPFCSCSCPYAKEDSRRKYIKSLIADIEKRCPYTKINMIRSMKRIKTQYLA